MSETDTGARGTQLDPDSPAGRPRMITVVEPHLACKFFPAPQSVRFSNRSTKSMLRTAGTSRGTKTQVSQDGRKGAARVIL